MIKKIVLGISILFSATISAQEGTASPYSFYGIGEVKFKGSVDSRSMGGIGVLIDSTSINLQNPAGYSFLQYSSLSIGGSNNRLNLKTNTQEEKAQRTSLDYLAVGIPMGKFGAAFGVMPYSAVGFKVNYTDQENGIDLSKRFTGSGGVNRVFAGLSYRFTTKLSLGADFQYNFGKSETTAYVLPFGLVNASQTRNVSRYSGFSTNIGAFYQTKFKKKYNLVASATYSPETKISSENERNIVTINEFLGGAITDNQDVPVEDTEISLPSKITLGTGLGVAKKWFLGAEYMIQGKGDFAYNNQNGQYSVSQETSERFSFGGYYIPKYNSFSSYFDRITYRAGYKFEQTGLVVNGKSIVDHAATLGFGLPVGNAISKVNIGLEYGKRGTRSNGLIEENYFGISVGLSFGDRWFMKPKYD